MVYRLASQVLKSTGLTLVLGTMGIAHAATSTNNGWVTQSILSGGKVQQQCAKGNPYCAARVPAPPTPQATFDPNQAPCDTANAPCGQAYSKQMTKNYQEGVADIPPPYTPCVSPEVCSSVPAWWQSTVGQPIQQKTIPYDPGTRPWTQKKTCGTQFVGGVYLDKPCAAGTQ
ncbi:MAG: hypothetical protein ACHQAX_09260 [Gammaproteobacteria bacterium]